MPYSDGSWGEKAKERSKRRCEYFREYSKKHYKYKPWVKPRLGIGVSISIVNMVLVRAKNKCELCGVQEKLLIHHKDKNQSNNILENLLLLCRGCHNHVHKTEGDEIKPHSKYMREWRKRRDFNHE